jgi:hypothetical protein
MRWTSTPDANRYQQRRMVHWFNPPHSIRIGIESFIGVLFGPFTDRREMQAALGPRQTIYPYEEDQGSRKEFWLDFIADTGDGWNSTYTMAWLLAQPSLTFTHQEQSLVLPRGRILIMGGDEVYPIANEDQYRYRTKGPYDAALPKLKGKEGPDLFAIPGNHDWYDGLLSFLRTFCQSRDIGAWNTRQSRSYFAIKLPYNWWLWGVDTQLRSDIDKPQLDYFTWVCKDNMKKGDRVILVAPVPGWLHVNRDERERQQDDAERGPHRILEFLEEQLIRKNGFDLCLTLAGDQHHYARYEDTTGTRHKISSGGGGAFLHGTHTLPRHLPLKEDDRTIVYFKTTAYPTAAASRKLVLGNLLFPFKNPLFSWWILGTLYLLHAWMLQLGSQDLATPFSKQLLRIPASDWLVPGRFFLPQALWSILDAYLDVIRVTPEVLIFPVGLLLGLTLFCTPRQRSYSFLAVRKLIGGILHAPLHWLLSLILFWAFVSVNSLFIPWFMSLLPISLRDQLATWFPRLLFSVEMIFIGGLAGGFLFGLYLLLANRVFHYHDETAFSSLRIQDYKNFLRLKISPQELSVYPIGVDKVPRRWRMKPANGQTSRFEPVDRQITPLLIEDPIVIRGSAPGLQVASHEQGIGFTFQETMEGWFSMDRISAMLPAEGAARGQIANTKLTLNLTVQINNLDRFICDEQHRGLLHAQIVFPALSPTPIRARNGFVALFARYAQTARKRMIYELAFTFKGQDYYLAGEKLVEDEPGIDFWKDTTTLQTRLHLGQSKSGQVVGAGILRITLPGLLRQTASMRALNAASCRERFQAFGVFLFFFANEMWDSYFKRAKGVSFKALFFPWLGLGAFYVVHAWALGADFVSQLGGIHLGEVIRSLWTAYRDAFTASPWIIALPLALWLCLTLYSIKQDAFPRLDRSARFWRTVLSLLHTGAHMFLNLMLIWAFVHLNAGVLARLGAIPTKTLLALEMFLVGGYAAGLLFRILKQVKLRRPYVG